VRAQRNVISTGSPAISVAAAAQVFNGVTISTCLFIVFCALTYSVGQRTAIAVADADRRRRFKTRCLNVLIWGIFLVYPQVRAARRALAYTAARVS
jgi:hypothetical protein